MANMVDLFKGGSPVVKYMWDEKDYVQFGGSFAENGFSDTPPYDSHVDGAYNVGTSALACPSIRRLWHTSARRSPAIRLR